VITTVAVAVLFVLLFQISKNAFGWLTPKFLMGYSSRFPQNSGVLPGLIGSAYIICLTIIIAVPFGVGCSIYLEEYARDTFLTKMIKINISNLSATPSIVYGLLGLFVFVRVFGFGSSILSGALTMTLVVLPIIIVSSQEALKAVPQFLRHGSLAMGATRWQTIRCIVLPTAMPGIITGIILSISRALGETAPLVMIGAATYIRFLPNSPLSSFTALPLQIYEWTGRPQADFQSVASAGIIVLLVLLLTFNISAIILRNKYQKNTM
jgi:phosphate transport system permease protein